MEQNTPASECLTLLLFRFWREVFLILPLNTLPVTTVPGLSLFWVALTEYGGVGGLGRAGG